MCTWSFAYHETRKSNWQQIAADEFRFKDRIDRIGKIITPILNKDHRERIATKLNLQEK